MTQPSPMPPFAYDDHDDWQLRRALRAPLFAADCIQIIDINTSGCPSIVRSGSTIEAQAYLRKMASLCFTEVQLASKVEEAIRSGYPDVTVTYRRLGDTCSSGHLWTVHCQPEDS